MWVKLLMGDNNLNNIAKIFFSNVHNHIEEKKLTILQKLNKYFTLKKHFFSRFNESIIEFTLNWIPFMK